MQAQQLVPQFVVVPISEGRSGGSPAALAFGDERHQAEHNQGRRRAECNTRERQSQELPRCGSAMPAISATAAVVRLSGLRNPRKMRNNEHPDHARVRCGI